MWWSLLTFSIRYQRGDQGPDTELGGVLDAGGGGEGGLLPAPIGGPNVCRSRGRGRACCPGWTQKGTTGLCLEPICAGCGADGRCIKPNVCLCDGGTRVSPGGCGKGPRSQQNSTAAACETTCLNGGTCHPETGTCTCRAGYAGNYCQEPVCGRECANGGRCIGPNRCACVYGYTGRRCEIDYRTGPCYR